MNVVTTAPIASTPTQATSRRRYVPYLIFTLYASLYFLPFMRFLWSRTEEGTLVYGAVRIVHGQVFARNFFEVMGPGTFYWLAFFFKLFGVTFAATRICLFVTSLGTGLSMYFLSRRICGRYQILPAILLVGVYFSTLWPVVSHHIDSNFFGLLSVVCIVLWYDKRKNSLLFAAGILTGVTTCILQPKGMLLILAMLLWLWIQRRSRSVSLSSLGVILASYCSAIGVVVLYFWNRGALGNLVYMNFVWPSQHYGTVNAVPYARGILQYWTHWEIPIHGIYLLTPVAVLLLLPFLLVAALPALVPILGIPHRRDNIKPIILLYWFCGCALWLSEIHRKDIAHLVAASPLLIILCIYFLAEYRSKIADLALQFLSISAGALATVNLFIVLTARPVATRVGVVAMFKPDPVLTFLDRYTTPGEEIFAFPYCPMYYFLSSTTNPTRYSLLLYNYNTASQFYEVIRVLDQQKVRYVLWDTNYETKAAGSLFSASARLPAGGFLIEPYLESHYNLVKEVNGTRIMERKNEDLAK